MSPAVWAVAVAGGMSVSLMILGAATGIARRCKARYVDGRLTRPERRQFRQIEQGYSLTASEPGRRL